MIRVFNDHGDRTDRKKARLKYLVDRWGIEKFLDETAEATGVSPAACAAFGMRSAAGRSTGMAISGFTHSEKPGFRYIGVGVPVGKLSVAQMRAVADIAERYGRGEMRFTVWQNLLLPHIATENVEDVTAALAAMD